MLLFVERIIEYIGSVWRRNLFEKKAKKCGTNIAVYGKIYHINPNVEVGNSVKIYPDVQFFGDGPIVIGSNVSIGNGTVLYASKSGGIFIGDDTIIAAQGYIVDMNHGIEENSLIRKQPCIAEKVVIGKDVWLGANVTVLKGCIIGDGAVIGAKSLVNKNVECNTIAVGIPIKIRGTRG